jgi:hypothetical protein
MASPSPRAIAALVGHAWREVLLDDDAPDGLGWHPWHKVPPFVLDMSAAYALGYRPVGDYAMTVADEVRWLVDLARRDGETRLPPGLDEEQFAGRFDYTAEDAYLARQRVPPIRPTRAPRTRSRHVADRPPCAR